MKRITYWLWFIAEAFVSLFWHRTIHRKEQTPRGEMTWEVWEPIWRPTKHLDKK